MTNIITKKYTHLTEKERELLAHYIYKGYAIRKIARMLGRSPATISREIKRNGGVRVYNEDNVICKAKERW